MKFFVKTFLKIVLALSLGVQTSRAEAPLCSDIFSTQRSITDNYDQSRQSSWFIIKKTQAIQHLKVFYEYQKFFAENENNPVLNDSQTKYLFKKILTEFITDKSRLSKEDLDFIFSTPERRKFFEGVLYYQAVIEIPFRTLQQLIQYTGTRGQGFDLWNAPTVQGKVKHLFQSFYNGPLKYMLLVPIGVDLPGGLSPTAKIFKKLWKDGSYDPTPEEWQTLKAYKSEKIFNERKDFMNEHRQWVRVRRLTDYALNAILAISIIEAFNLYLEVDQQDATVDAAEFLNNPRYALAQDEVRVYNETVPFPHMAIEIDGLVYSYGQTHMTVRGAREYIFEEKMHDQALAGKKAQEQTFLQKAISFSGLDKMERVIQSVRIHLSMEEKGKLKRYLEMQTGKRYRNQTLAMDCSTMVVKALNANTQMALPVFIDPSPSQIILYLTSLKRMGLKNNEGKNLVEEVLQIRVSKNAENKQHVWRNLYINLFETRLYWSFLNFSLAQRGYLEARYGSKNLAYWDDETLNYFKLQEQEIRENFKNELQQGQFGIFANALKGSRTPEQKEALRSAIKTYFDFEKSRIIEKLDSNDTRFEDIMKNTLQLTLLKETEEKMLGEL